jgi:hypothetical protein
MVLTMGVQQLGQQNSFKGSVFAEFETEEHAKDFLAQSSGGEIQEEGQRGDQLNEARSAYPGGSDGEEWV